MPRHHSLLSPGSAFFMDLDGKAFFVYTGEYSRSGVKFQLEPNKDEDLKMGFPYANTLQELAKQVPHPLGLAGFALFLVFLTIGMKRRGNQAGKTVLYALAALALTGGLVLEFRNHPVDQLPPTIQAGRIDQKVHGANNLASGLNAGQINQACPTGKSVPGTASGTAQLSQPSPAVKVGDINQDVGGKGNAASAVNTGQISVPCPPGPKPSASASAIDK
jgi:hypothetical protein